MSLAERVAQLNQEIGGAVERALTGLREEIAGRVRTGSEEIVRRIEELTPDLPSRLFGHEDFLPDIEKLESETRRRALADLARSTSALDRGRSQTDILTALLEESGYFASRTVLLLVRGGELRGWGGHGMDAEAAIRAVSLTPEEGTAWSRVLAGGGGERLSAADCSPLCNPTGIPLPQEGVLLPMVLRDKVAAVFYADRMEGRDLDVEALQLLIYSAAQAIELLPFRERASTITLAPVSPGAAGTVGSVGSVGTVGSIGSVGAAPAAQTADTAVSEPASAPSPVPEPVAPAAAPEPEVEAAAPEAPSPQPPAAVPPAPPTPLGGRETVLLQRSWMNVADEPAATDQDQAIPTTEIPISSLPASAPWAAPAEGAADGAGDAGRQGGAAEVHPPSDVQGPGWAFSSPRVPASPSEDSIHEEARRLARLLVSEIKLYNEEQVEAGRRNRDLYERLREDIDRSRQMYEERIDPRLVKSTDYFYQELVRILAAGDAKVLGI